MRQGADMELSPSTWPPLYGIIFSMVQCWHLFLSTMLTSMLNVCIDRRKPQHWWPPTRRCLTRWISTAVLAVIASNHVYTIRHFYIVRHCTTMLSARPHDFCRYDFCRSTGSDKSWPCRLTSVVSRRRGFTIHSTLYAWSLTMIPSWFQLVRA